ncbi:hypothetical protein [Halorussus marinus]|uniref:hypothetical protein n=1 Tax=Halorussus marinus TaxID=2505976 RepID=UPI00106E6E3E|nr:hypothetical protein [Halorussus marinus]
MPTCHNCGHDGTFVLLAQFALAVPGDSTGGVADRDAEGPAFSTRGDWSLAVQCPACASTDVDETALDLLVRHATPASP